LERNLILTALLAIAAAVLFDANTVTVVQGQLTTWILQWAPSTGGPWITPLATGLPVLLKGIAILCLVAIPVAWLKPR
jgi:hypothetical protein